MQMAHERLDVYKLSMEVSRWMLSLTFPKGLSDLKNQGCRAATSVTLNLAEGLQRRGRARSNHLAIARGSAAETLTVIDLVRPLRADEMMEKLRRVDRMLEKLGG